MTARSVLCVPGHDARKVERCRDFGADIILFDLEDSVPEESKGLALATVCAAVLPGDAVRVCDRGHVLFNAQLAALESLVETVWIPKVRTAATLHNRLPWGGQVWALVECPAGVLNVGEIAGECHGLAFGRYDFMAATGITDVWAPLVEHAMGQIAMAAHAVGIQCSDAPCYSLTDTALMEREVRRAKGYGFASKGCVHPAQIAYCAALGPTAEDVAGAHRVAGAPGGVTRADSLLLGPPMVKLAQRILGDAA